jgi:formamidopyrimidine-DNA glycosylase
MPELPEVETTRRGIAPHLTGRTVTGVTLRTAKLRLPLSAELPRRLAGQRIAAIARRGKYLLFTCSDGTLLLHLGMTGHLRLVPSDSAPGKHAHVELHFDNNTTLRFTDPRKFGTLLWLTGEPLQHPLLAELGPEPLSADFTAEYLFKRSRKRSVATKLFIMNSKIVVGVGNIYANEALFLASINPARAVGSLAPAETERLTAAIKQVLTEAIDLGGTTLHDYLDAAGQPGYFSLKLHAYGRSGKPCSVCGTVLQESRLGNRSTVWCPKCQQ